MESKYSTEKSSWTPLWCFCCSSESIYDLECLWVCKASTKAIIQRPVNVLNCNKEIEIFAATVVADCLRKISRIHTTLLTLLYMSMLSGPYICL